jgi:hypothetical protein
MRIWPIYLIALAAFTAADAGAHGVATVTTADDSGAGSLRAALTTADDGSQVEFAIPGAGVHTITLLTPLPPIQAGVSIDGTTQPGASCATWPPTLQIEINGESLASGDVLTVAGANVAIRGLVVNSGPANGIGVGAFANFSLTCSFVGPDPTGSQDFGNAADGIHLVGSTGAQIGGNTATTRNLISANAESGIAMDAAASGNGVAGNYIGTTVAGTAGLANGRGIEIQGVGNAIGGLILGSGNVISGNVGSGISLDASTATGNQIHRNRIGLDAAGFTLPNGGAGVDVSLNASDNEIGNVGNGNDISANGGGGVVVSGDGSLGNSIRGNSLSSNGTIGIDLLGEFFADPNDTGDPDVGPNRLQNTPVFVSASYTAASNALHAEFSVDTAPANATYPLAIDFYKADADDEEGAIYLGSASYSTDDFAVGDVHRSFIAQGGVAAGDRIVATATDAAGNTSEYCDAPATLAVPEPSAAAAGLAALAALVRRARRR